MSFYTANIVWCGDSITIGTHLTPSDGTSTDLYVNKVLAALTTAGVTYTSHNLAAGGATCDNAGQASDAVAFYDSTKQRNICYALFGANDGLTKSASTFEADLASFVATVTAGGFVPLVATMLPCGSYDSVAFRAAINANTLATYVHVCDIGNTSTAMGAEAAKNDAALYSDTVHPTPLGNTDLAPLVETALRAMLLVPSGRARFRTKFL